ARAPTAAERTPKRRDVGARPPPAKVVPGANRPAPERAAAAAAAAATPARRRRARAGSSGADAGHIRNADGQRGTSSPPEDRGLSLPRAPAALGGARLGPCARRVPRAARGRPLALAARLPQAHGSRPPALCVQRSCAQHPRAGFREPRAPRLRLSREALL